MNTQSENLTSLPDAIEFGDVNTMQHYLTEANVDGKYTPAHLEAAIHCNDILSIKKAVSIINILSEEDQLNVLWAAVDSGANENLEFLLNRYSFSDEVITCAACWACSASLEKVKSILPFLPNSVSDLHIGLSNAILSNHGDIIDYLSEMGYKAEIRHIYDATEAIRDSDMQLSDSDQYYEMIKAVIVSAKSSYVNLNNFYLDKAGFRPYRWTSYGPNVDVYDPCEESDKKTSLRIFKLLLESGAGLENPAMFFFSSNDFNIFREQFRIENPNSTMGFVNNWVDDCREGFLAIRNDEECNQLLKDRFPLNYKAPKN